jgi:hypothetical protein
MKERTFLDDGDCHGGAECCLKRMFRRGSSREACEEFAASDVGYVVPTARLPGKTMDANPAGMRVAVAPGRRHAGPCKEGKKPALRVTIHPL